MAKGVVEKENVKLSTEIRRLRRQNSELESRVRELELEAEGRKFEETFVRQNQIAYATASGLRGDG